MPTPSPSPAATITVMEMMPQAMPNMVSSVRRLCAQSVASVSFNRSRKDMAFVSQSLPQLLQDDLLLFVEALQNFSFYAVGDAQLHGDFPPSLIGFGVGSLDSGVALFVVDERRFRDHQHVFLFFQHDLGIRAHVGLPIPTGIAVRNPPFKPTHVSFFLPY